LACRDSGVPPRSAALKDGPESAQAGSMIVGRHVSSGPSARERTLPHAAAPRDIVADFNAAWAAGDIEGALAFIAEDAVYELHISGDVLPFGGVTAGRANIAAALHQIRSQFEYILYRPLRNSADGDTVRFQVEFMYRHRASGEVLSGRFRMVMRTRDGLIVRADEYHDRAKVEAFMRLVGSRRRT
jgi:ketosteroid isomerase-like protein